MNDVQDERSDGAAPTRAVVEYANPLNFYIDHLLSVSTGSLVDMSFA